MEQSQNTDLIFKAIAAAQANFGAAVKDAVNPYFNSKYADLGAVWDSVRGALADNELSVMQDVVQSTLEDHIGIITQVNHSSGQWVRFGPVPMPVPKVARKDGSWGLPPAHAFGSSITYGRRYALAAAFGVIADEDDDGNGASPKEPSPSAGEARPKPPGASATGRIVKDILLSQCGCNTKEKAMDIMDAATCGTHRLEELENETKSKVILGIFENLNKSIPYTEWFKRIDEVRAGGADTQIGDILSGTF